MLWVCYTLYGYAPMHCTSVNVGWRREGRGEGGGEGVHLTVAYSDKPYQGCTGDT